MDIYLPARRRHAAGALLDHDTSRGRPAAGRGVRSGRFRSVGEWRGVRPHVRAHALLVHAAYRPAGPGRRIRRRPATRTATFLHPGRSPTPRCAPPIALL